MKQTPSMPPVSGSFSQPLRTMVVDNSAVFLQTFCFYLKTQPMFQVVGTAMDGGEALHMAELLEPDLVFMDLHMPVIDGLQATAILRRRLPNVRIIIITLEDSATHEAQARAHGAHGFIWKRQIISGLITEARRVFHSDTRMTGGTGHTDEQPRSNT